MKQYITTIDTPTDSHKRKAIIHNGMWHFGSFSTLEQLNRLAKKLGFTYELVEERQAIGDEEQNIFRIYKLSHTIKNPFGGGFGSLEQLPEGAKPIKALSNGSIVTCYFTNDGETITMYRPNPNAKDVYKPLELQEHIRHQKEHGTY